jgi:hypothetical protein
MQDLTVGAPCRVVLLLLVPTLLHLRLVLHLLHGLHLSARWLHRLGGASGVRKVELHL